MMAFTKNKSKMFLPNMADKAALDVAKICDIYDMYYLAALPASPLSGIGEARGKGAE